MQCGGNAHCQTGAWSVSCDALRVQGKGAGATVHSRSQPSAPDPCLTIAPLALSLSLCSTGNFHVSAHAHQDLLPLFYNFHHGENLNLTHEVHHLSFGGEGSDELARSVGEAAAVSPLNGAKQVAIMMPEDQGAPKSYEYFLKVRFGLRSFFLWRTRATLGCIRSLLCSFLRALLRSFPPSS